MVLTVQSYEHIALADPRRKWEMVDGELREKPPMSARHSQLLSGLDRQLILQLDPARHESWSPSTGTHDMNTKLPLYRERGDAEIWRLHPFDRDVVAWRRQPDGRYTESRVSGGRVTLLALPDVTIDLDKVFGLLPPT